MPPNVPTTFTADAGSAVPAANILIITADDITGNNQSGIQSVAGAGQTGGDGMPLAANELQVQLTNRIQGSGSTVGAATADLITFDLGATPGVYTFDVRVSAFESTTPAGAGYSLFYAFRTTGAAATLIDNTDRINHEEAAITGANALAVASGNNVVIRVTGVSDGGAGYNINWNADGYYTFVS